MFEKLRISLILLLLPLCGISQDSGKSDSETWKKHWAIGANVSVDYCYRSLDIRDGFSQVESNVEFRDKLEIPMIRYTTGINLSRSFSKKFSMEGGVQYSVKGYELDVSGLTFGDMIDPRYGFVYESPEILHMYYSYQYLDVPLRVVFTTGMKKVRFISSAGFATNILLKAGTLTKSESQNGDKQTSRVNDKQNYKRFNLSPSVSLGADYKLNDKFNLRLEGVFRYGLFHTSYTPVTQYLWNAGLNFSCYYSFRKAD